MDAHLAVAVGQAEQLISRLAPSPRFPRHHQFGCAIVLCACLQSVHHSILLRHSQTRLSPCPPSLSDPFPRPSSPAQPFSLIHIKDGLLAGKYDGAKEFYLALKAIFSALAPLVDTAPDVWRAAQLLDAETDEAWATVVSLQASEVARGSLTNPLPDTDELFDAAGPDSHAPALGRPATASPCVTAATSDEAFGRPLPADESDSDIEIICQPKRKHADGSPGAAKRPCRPEPPSDGWLTPSAALDPPAQAAALLGALVNALVAAGLAMLAEHLSQLRALVAREPGAFGDIRTLDVHLIAAISNASRTPSCAETYILQRLIQELPRLDSLDQRAMELRLGRQLDAIVRRTPPVALPADEASCRPPERKSSLSLISFRGSCISNGEWVHVFDRSKAEKPIVGLVHECWVDHVESQTYLTICRYLRAEDTYALSAISTSSSPSIQPTPQPIMNNSKQPLKQFISNEVFRTLSFECYPIEDFLEKCLVLSLADFLRGRPRQEQIKSVYVCRSSYNPVLRQLSDIRHDFDKFMPPGYRVPELELFPRPLKEEELKVEDWAKAMERQKSGESVKEPSQFHDNQVLMVDNNQRALNDLVNFFRGLPNGQHGASRPNGSANVPTGELRQVQSESGHRGTLKQPITPSTGQSGRSQELCGQVVGGSTSRTQSTGTAHQHHHQQQHQQQPQPVQLLQHFQASQQPASSSGSQQVSPVTAEGPARVQHQQFWQHNQVAQQLAWQKQQQQQQHLQQQHLFQQQQQQQQVQQNHQPHQKQYHQRQDWQMQQYQQQLQQKQHPHPQPQQQLQLQQLQQLKQQQRLQQQQNQQQQQSQQQQKHPQPQQQQQQQQHLQQQQQQQQRQLQQQYQYQQQQNQKQQSQLQSQAYQVLSPGARTSMAVESLTASQMQQASQQQLQQQLRHQRPQHPAQLSNVGTSQLAMPVHPGQQQSNSTGLPPVTHQQLDQPPAHSHPQPSPHQKALVGVAKDRQRHSVGPGTHVQASIEASNHPAHRLPRPSLGSAPNLAHTTSFPAQSSTPNAGNPTRFAGQHLAATNGPARTGEGLLLSGSHVSHATAFGGTQVPLTDAVGQARLVELPSSPGPMISNAELNMLISMGDLARCEQWLRWCLEPGTALEGVEVELSRLYQLYGSFCNAHALGVPDRTWFAETVVGCFKNHGPGSVRLVAITSGVGVKGVKYRHRQQLSSSSSPTTAHWSPIQSVKKLSVDQPRRMSKTPTTTEGMMIATLEESPQELIKLIKSLQDELVKTKLEVEEIRSRQGAIIGWEKKMEDEIRAVKMEMLRMSGSGVVERPHDDDQQDQGRNENHNTGYGGDEEGKRPEKSKGKERTLGLSDTLALLPSWSSVGLGGSKDDDEDKDAFDANDVDEGAASGNQGGGCDGGMADGDGDDGRGGNGEMSVGKLEDDL